MVGSGKDARATDPKAVELIQRVKGHGYATKIAVLEDEAKRVAEAYREAIGTIREWKDASDV